MDIDVTIKKWEEKHFNLLSEYSKDANNEVMQMYRSQMKDILDFINDLNQIKNKFSLIENNSKIKLELELRQMFKNLSDCYADTAIIGNDGRHIEGEVIQAMTEDRFIEVLKEAKIINNTASNIIISEYEYEMLFDSEPNEPIQIHGWYPIATDRIRNPEKIDHYIEIGLIRRIN